MIIDIKRCVQELFPNAVDEFDFEVMDDGNGPRVTQWNLPDPQPTQEELEAAWSATVQGKIAKEGIKRELAGTDKDLPRALEDLIDLQIAKGQILLSELPQSIQNKINNKKTLRDQLA